MKKLLVIVAFVVGLQGCSSSVLPPRTSAAGEAADSLAGITVAVEHDRFPVYSDQLRQHLIDTRLFDRVDFVENLTAPTLVARVERHVYGRAVLPIWTALSLGIIPTIVTEEHGLVYSLRRAGTDEQPVTIEATYTGRTILGWVAALANLSPNYSARDPRSTQRFKDFFRSATAAKARALLSQ